MKLSELINARRIISDCADKEISPRASYRIMKFMNATEKDNEFYYSKIQEMIQKYAKKDKGGNYVQSDGNVVIAEDKVAEANAAALEIDNIDVEVDEKYWLRLEDFEDLKLSCRQMQALMPVLKEEQ